MNIAIFGGSFNPVHMGHYKIVESLLTFCAMDKIIVVPAFQNPLKDNRPETPAKIRLKMLQTTFQKIKKVDVSDLEISSNTKSYTYQTLQHFKTEFPKDQLFLTIGEDVLSSLNKWIRIDIITRLTKILVFKY